MVDIYALIGILPDAALIAAPDGRIVAANAQAALMFRHSEAGLLDLHVEDLLPESARGRHVSHRDRYIAAPRPRPMAPGSTLSAQRNNGEVFQVEVSLAPVEAGQTLAVIRDVSARMQQANAEMQTQLIALQSQVIDLLRERVQQSA